MDAKTPHDCDKHLFHANIEALHRVDTACATTLSDEQPPFQTECVLARDGEPTYAWSNGSGRRMWLGQTTMPKVRATALIDAFNTGSQNILLVGIGQGAALERLLGRLLPHQAVFVIEEVTWAAGLVLRLHDFSDAIQSGRLRLFLGGEPWEALRRFLEGNGGYLAPDRILAWPWLEPNQTAALTRKLADINKHIAQQRAEKLATIRSTPLASEHTNAIVVTSNIAQPRIRRAARMIAAAAEEQERPCETFVLDAPVSVHPVAYAESIQRLRPALIVSIESLPETTSSCDAPPVLVLLTGHDQTLQRDKIAMLPPGSLIGVCNDRQRDEAVAAGFPAERVLSVQPAACPGISPTGATRTRIAIVGDLIDCSPLAAGLNLVTHQRLFRKAGELIRETIDSGADATAEAVLSEAEKQLKIRLESQQVRAGILERIHNRLIPAQARSVCNDALRREGIEFRMFGEGRRGVETRPEEAGAPWPPPSDLPQTLSELGMLIVPHPDESTAQAVLDATAAGMVVAVRTLAKDANALRPVLPESVIRFASPGELVGIVRAFESSPESMLESARGAAVETASRDTWTHRLAAIMADVESRCRS